jgi:hypothetical protein
MDWVHVTTSNKGTTRTKAQDATSHHPPVRFTPIHTSALDLITSETWVLYQFYQYTVKREKQGKRMLFNGSRFDFLELYGVMVAERQVHGGGGGPRQAPWSGGGRG